MKPLVDPEHQMQGSREDERRLTLDIGQRRIGGEPDDGALVDIANVVAADGMLGERVAIVVRRTETNGHAGQPGHRLDHPDELRRSKNAAELAIAGGKIGDADGAAVAVGQYGRDHRGIAQIFRLEIGHVVEDDIGKSLLVVARQQPTEDRVTVEARITPPYQARRGIDERSRAPIADDRKIKPMIDHEAASASVREICSSQWRTSVGRSKHDLTPGTLRPDRDPDAVKIGHDLEHAQVGFVVTDEERPAIGKRRVGHQFANGGGLGETGLLDFHHQLAGQQLDRGRLELIANLGSSLPHEAFLFRSQPVVQRQRVALVLEDDAGPRFRDGGKLALHAGVERRQPRRLRGSAGSRAQFGAMATDRGQLQRRKNQIELADGPPAHEGDGPAGAVPKSPQRLAQRMRNIDLARRRGEVEKRAIHVQQNGELAEIGRN